MNWLEEARRTAKFRSPDELAKSIRTDPTWPEAVKLGLRSFGNRIRKLEQHEGHAWWERRPAIIALLATRLGQSAEQLTERIAEDRRYFGSTTTSTRIELDRFGLLFPLGLGKEPLPPGIPREAWRPQLRTARSWWTYASRRDCELVGRWFAARGGTYLVGETWDEIRPNVPAEGSLFVLLSEQAARTNFDEVEEDAELDDLDILIAAPFACPNDPDSVWEPIEFAPVHELADEITAWINARSRSRQPLLDVRNLPVIRELLASLCTGAVDAVDALASLAGFETSPQHRFQPDPAQLRRYLERLSTTFASKDKALAAWVATEAETILMAVARGLVESGYEAWEDGLTRSQWAALLPEHGVDPERVERAWEKVKTRRSVKPRQALAELEQLLEPAEVRVLGRLQDAGLLVRTTGDLLALSPAWLGRYLRLVVVNTIVDGDSGAAIGSLLLQDALAERVLNRLLDEAEVNGSHRLIELVDRSERKRPDLETVAFHEACFRIFGLARLKNRSLPKNHVELVWKLQMNYVVPAGRGFPPLPMIPLGSSETLGLGADPLFYLAYVSLANSSGNDDRRFTAEHVLESLTSADEIVNAVRPSLLQQSYIDVARFASREMTQQQCPALHQATIPSALFFYLSRFEHLHGVPKTIRKSLFSALDAADDSFRLSEALTMLHGFDGVSSVTIQQAIWRSRATGPSPNHAPITWMSRAPRAAAWLWVNAPEDCARGYIEAKAIDPLAFIPEVAQTFSPTLWSAWLGRLSGVLVKDPNSLDATSNVLVIAPNDVILNAIERLLSPERTPTVLRALWEKRANVLLDAMSSRVKHAAQLATTAPPEHVERVVKLVGLLAPQQISKNSKGQLVRWLRDQFRAQRNREEIGRVLRSFAAQ